MKDISSVTDGLDLGILETQTPRAANILSIQLGSLEYAQAFGIDLAFFLKSDFQFQDASFKAYLIQVLAQYGINLSSLLDEKFPLYDQYTFQIKPEETTTALVTR